MWDGPFRQQLLDGLVELGCAVEAAFDGTPQVCVVADFVRMLPLAARRSPLADTNTRTPLATSL
jgi:hypothetical protein